MRGRTLLGPLWLGLLLAGWDFDVKARGEEPVAPRMRFESSEVIQRFSAPALLYVQLKPPPGGLAPGRLRGTIFDGPTSVVEFTSEELTPAAAGQRVRLVIPPIPPGHESLFFGRQTPLRVVVEYDTGTQRFQLDELPMFLGSAAGTLAIVYNATGEEVRGLPGGSEFLTRLAPETWTPKLPADPLVLQPLWPAWQTRLLTANVADLPSDPLLYTACDVLLLSGGNLAQLRSDQREAIEPWLAAGGRLALVLPPTPLRAEVLAWLNRLTAADEGGWLVAQPGSGLVQLPAGESLRRARHGLGRVVIFAADTSGNLAETNRLAEALPFLWGWNAEQTQEFQATREWKPGLADATDEVRGWRDPAESFPASAIRQQLLPQDMEPLSLTFMGGLLGVYLLLIGPLDYLLLGRWKARRWTWLTFPAITVLTTVTLVTLSNRQLAGVEEGAALLLIDLDTANQPLRVTRLECQVSPREQQVTRTVQRGWVSNEAYSLNTESLPRFSGSPARGLSVDVMVPQWSPRLIRETWLPQPVTGELATGPQVPACPIDFGPIMKQLSEAGDSNARFQRAREWVAGLPIEIARVDLFDGEQSPVLRASQRETVRLPIAELSRWRTELSPPSSDATMKPFERRRPAVWRSPAPGGDLRDLRLHDTTDPNSCLLTVVTQAPTGEFLVWRRFLAGD